MMKVILYFIKKVKEGSIMENYDLNRKTRTKVEDQGSLKGTFTSVLLLGGFLILSWVGVFLLFIKRF
jgi:hypothetical protein